MEENLPIVNLELTTGTFRIKTQDAIYQITVTHDSSLTRVVEKVVEKETSPGDAQTQLEELFYQEFSEELYKEIGKLARKLSLSIKDIPGEHFSGVDIEKTGVELEGAKGQLEDIVQMTEKATMDIMDLAETIQEDLHNVDDMLKTLKELDFMNDGLSEGEDLDWDEDLPSADADQAPAKTGVDRMEFIDELLEIEGRLKETINNLPRVGSTPPAEEPEPEPEAAPEVKKVTTYSFEIDVVFQTLYELCTNEAVKDHIKAMRADQNTAFDTAAVLKTLSDQAPKVDVEDNFFNFPISGILKSLFAATNNERYKQVLKKMNQTMGSIFLDSLLPIEGSIEEKEVAVAAEKPAPKESAPSATPQPGLPEETIADILALVDEASGRLEAEKEKLADQEQAAACDMDDVSLGPDFTKVLKGDREKIIGSVNGSTEMLNRIMSHITRILEALSFQDLSGQRIYKIVRLISDVQVQLLSLVVAFGAKIKKKQAQQDISSAEAEKLAQSEVDKMLERVAGPSKLEGPEAKGRLDQDSVDDLLAELGF